MIFFYFFGQLSFVLDESYKKLLILSFFKGQFLFSLSNLMFLSFYFTYFYPDFYDFFSSINFGLYLFFIF